MVLWWTGNAQSGIKANGRWTKKSLHQSLLSEYALENIPTDLIQIKK